MLPPVPLFHETSPFEKWCLAWDERQRKLQADFYKLANKLEEDLREFWAFERAESAAEMEPEHEPEEDSVLDLTSESCPEEVAVLDLTADSCREEVADEHSRPRGRRIA